MVATTLNGHSSWHLWCGFLVSLASYFQVTIGQEYLVVTPVNMASVKGVPLQINCAAKDDQVAVSWYDYSQGIREVSLNDDNFYKNMYTIGGIPPVYNLQIHKLKLSSGGQYACIASTEYGYSEIVVLDADPACWTNVSADGISVSGDYVEVTCSVTYSASSEQWAPRFTWNPPQGADFSANYSESDYKKHGAVYNSSVVVEITPQLDNALINTHVDFKVPPDQEYYFASNDPDYSFAWYSRPLNVQFPPEDLRICPDEITYLPGSTILCFGKSKPLATYKWIDMLTNNTLDGATLKVPEHQLEGNNEYKYKCAATNVIRGVEQQTESHVVHFKVVTNDKPKDRRVLILSGVIAILAVLLIFVIAAFIGYCRRQKRSAPKAYAY